MADYAYFYNSQNGDRKYDADSFSDWLKKFFTTGVFADDLFVESTGDMKISVATGYANIGGKVRLFDAIQSFTIATPDATYDRIDTVVVERNDTDRNIVLKLVKGDYSTNPVPTEPVREGNIYQLVLAEIYVEAGAVRITQANITDKRTDTDVCGIVAGTVTEMDFSQFSEQFQTYYDDFKSGNEADFDDWFKHLHNELDSNQAAHLQNQIDAIVAITNAEIDSLFE